MRALLLLTVLGLAGCAHAPIGRYGVTSAEVHASGGQAANVAADGDLVVRSKRCRLATSDIATVLDIAERAPLMPEPVEGNISGSRYAHPPAVRYSIRFRRGRQVPVLLFFDPKPEPLRGWHGIQFNGTLRSFTGAEMAALQGAVARSGCGTWAKDTKTI